MADRNYGTAEISSKEFQRQLFDWFDKRGLLSELRAFMRHRMISALYGSDSPCPAPHFSTHISISPTLQALLLLVAEFLVQQEYHYTMSVMVAEVPLLASFPKFSNYVSYMSSSDPSSIQRGSDFPRYTEKDVLEILDVLGLTSSSESAKHILRLYLNNSARESLLVCVLTALSAIVQHCHDEGAKNNITLQSSDKKTDNLPQSTQWIEEIRLVLLRAQMTSAQLQQVEELIRKLYADTADRIRREEKEKHTQLQYIREKELLADTLLREEKLRVQMQEAEDDLRVKQTHLEQVTAQLRQQHDEVLNRLNRVQRHADEIRMQESELNQKEKALEKKQAIIEEEHVTLAGLRAELQEAAHSIRQEHSDNKTLLELSRLQGRCLHLENELKDAKNQLFAPAVIRTEMRVQATEEIVSEGDLPEDDIVSHQKSSGSSTSSSNSHSKAKVRTGQKEKNNQVTLLKKVLCRVQQENTELRANAAQQRRRIDELTSKAAQLAAHIADQAGPAQSEAQGSHQQPPPTPPLPPRHVRLGGHIAALPGHSPGAATHTTRLQGREWRRKPPKRLIQNSSLTTSISSDDSPTEEVLREARNRLKRLEEESEAVDRSYQDFRTRQADNLASATPILFVPTQHAPPDTQVSQTSKEVQTSHAEEPVLPTLMRSSLLTSPSAALRPSALAPSVFSGVTTSPGFPSNSLILPRSQFLYPERQYLSFPQTDNTFKLSESLTYKPSVLRRPINKFRNLLGGRSNFLKDLSTRDEGTQSEKRDILLDSPEPKQSTTSMMPPHQEHTCSNISRASEGLHKMSLRSPAKKLLDNDMEEVNTSFCKYQPNADNYLPQDSHITSAHLPSVKENVPESHTVTKEEIMPQPPERNHSLSSSESHLSPVHLDDPEASQQPSLQQPVSSAAITKVESVQHSFVKPAVKSSVVDVTLNEISTLSSSPGLSVVNDRNRTVTSVIGTASQLEIKTNGKTPSALEFPGELQKNLIDLKLFPLKSTVSPKNKKTAEEANQLLNTSLSSIENTDQQLSGGKKSDEDDDFW